MDSRAPRGEVVKLVDVWKAYTEREFVLRGVNLEVAGGRVRRHSR